jgi:hypothetical protein
LGWLEAGRTSRKGCWVLISGFSFEELLKARMCVLAVVVQELIEKRDLGEEGRRMGCSYLEKIPSSHIYLLTPTDLANVSNDCLIIHFIPEPILFAFDAA